MRKIIGLVGIVAFMALYLVMHLYPEIPRTALGWLALFILGIPAWIFIEWLGEVILGSTFFKNSSRSLRIILGVPTVILLCGVAFFVVSFVNQYVKSAGG